MSLPPPVLAAFVVLIGWPLVQLASVLLVRGRRVRMRQLLTDLGQDSRYGQDDLALLDTVVRTSRGDPACVVFPVVVPLAILAASIGDLLGRPDRPAHRSTEAEDARADLIEDRFGAVEIELGRRTGRETIDEDGRVAEVRRLAFEIGLIRWPTSLLLTIALSLPVLPLYGLAYGLRRMTTVIPETAARLVESLRVTVGQIARQHG